MVRIHHRYAVKSQFKHNIEPARFAMLPIILEFGRAVLHIGENQERSISFFHYDTVVFGGWMHTAVKVVPAQTELWVRTFHPSRPSEVSRLTKKGVLLRQEIHIQ